MDIRLVDITIWNKKAYIATPARYMSEGSFTNIEPIFVINPTQAEVFPIVRSLLSKDPELLPNPTKDEIKTRRDLLPKITGARNWKNLCQNGIAYSIVCTNDGFDLEISDVDTKGRWIFPKENRINFPLVTDLSVVIQAILSDIEKRTK